MKGFMPMLWEKDSAGSLHSCSLLFLYGDIDIALSTEFLKCMSCVSLLKSFITVLMLTQLLVPLARDCNVSLSSDGLQHSRITLFSHQLKFIHHFGSGYFVLVLLTYNFGHLYSIKSISNEMSIFNRNNLEWLFLNLLK